MFALRDPQGYADTVAVPLAAAMLVTLMNGERSLGEIRQEFQRQVGRTVTLPEIEQVVGQLDELLFLDNARFAAFEAVQTEEYLALDVRPAVHAGGAYEGDPDKLRSQLGDLFTCSDGPGMHPHKTNGCAANNERNNRLCGLMSPHIDFHRGGPAFAWSYERVTTATDADLFVILGTAHSLLHGLFSISKKHFDTPLGTVTTDRAMIDHMQNLLAESNGNDQSLFNDEMPHRHEHSIEFQVLMLQYVLGGRRDFTIVPILVGSFQPFVLHQRQPIETPAVTEFIRALRASVEACGRRVCYVAGVDLAHIGRQFGDDELLSDQRLQAQREDDAQLLEHARRGSAADWFLHVAEQNDRNRICGLAPTYTMLEAIKPKRGELLKYDQAVAEDRTSCVSFASSAFYRS